MAYTPNKEGAATAHTSNKQVRTHQYNQTEEHDEMPESREVYIKSIQDKLEKIQSKIISMKEEGSRLGGDMKKKADESLTNLDSKHKELRFKLNEFKDSTQENWRAGRDVFEHGFKDLSTKFKGLFS